ncbi:hypothetical protein ABEB36_009167 [Hypothenemus hampei]|uniref:Cell division control protein n=1 Tax=Hypothenemus hampei TaxID=57062 RepID=A0ABD1EPW0_HYPHA
MATMRVTRSSTRNNRRENLTYVTSSSESENETEVILDKSVKPTRTPTKQKAASKPELEHLSLVTPPKQRKQQNKEIESLNTPSTLFKSLALTSPDKTVNNTSSKKNLFSSDSVIENQNLNLKQKDKTSAKYQYQTARKALHSNFPVELPGRENELKVIENFIQNHLENGSSGSIYISGPPGTGKTASLNLILEKPKILDVANKIYINCTAIKSATAVYARLNTELHVKVKGKSEKDNLQAFESYLKRKHKPILIILDEIDQLESKNHSILYTIFEWPSKLNSKIILVGIANALDLTDRILPRLQARCELKPQLLHFAPYTKEQIINIFTSRLKAAGASDVFNPLALQMLAGKVASVSGDVRRALDIGRRVVELIDKNRKQDSLKSVENYATEFIEKEVKKVNLKEVVTVLNNIYGTAQNLNEDNEDSFPLQQKIIICSLLLTLKKAKNKDITIGKLHEIYSKICSKRNLSAVDQAEFVGLCSLIETKGIIRVYGRKEPRMHKVTLEWNEHEVSEALKDKQLMSTILQDESCLGKQ